MLQQGKIMSAQADDPNAHIGSYLDYYISLPSAPNYAVMIEGPWGIGKTFLTKKLLSSRIQEPQKYVYVSLYGLSSLEQLDDALFGAFYRIFDSFGAKMVMGVVRGGLKAFRADPEFKRSDFLAKCYADLYVFDDLERCNMPVQQALGHINQIVEHSGGKVVILANEAELKKSKEYMAVKEKVVGKTLVVQPVVDAVLTHFLGQVQSNSARSFLADNFAVIRTTFELSNTQNFRLLQQSLWDFDRLFSALAPKQIGNTEAMETLLTHYLAYSFELKSGGLGNDQIRRDADKFEDIFDTVAAGTDLPRPPHKELAEKYRLLAGNRVELRGESWTKILLDGQIDAEIVSAALAWTGWFSDPADQPAWKIIWYRQFHSAEEVEAARDVVLAQVSSMSFIQAGEILHVFGLLLELSSIGALSCSTAEVLERGKRYVEELRAKRRLQLPPDFDHEEDFRFGSHGGLGFSGAKDAGFAEFQKHLQAIRILARSDLYDEQARTLLDNLKNDPEAFCTAISEPGGTLSRIPVFSKISPDVFVDALFALHPKVQNRVLMHLYWRYDHARLTHSLTDECAWAQSLVAELSARKDSAQPLDRDRIEFALGSYFKSVPSAEEANAEED
jgi:KAP family P-loop domain